ncbi:Ubiquitin-protein ligase E3C [Armadillidium vulgare]|nr:Ubiquitin-protein ligase E3C [Armadillidium vulgare]
MWSFEGEYKSRPKQSFGGKSRILDRNSLLHKLKTDREEREDQRRRQDAALKIQAWCRGNCHRKIINENLRMLCNDLFLEVKQKGLSIEIAEKIISILIIIFDPRYDLDNLFKICHQLVREEKSLSLWICNSMNKWKFLVPKLVSLALKNVIHFSDNKDKQTYSHAVPLRLLEVVSYPDSWSFPELYEVSVLPPNPIAETILGLQIQPIKVVSTLNDTTMSSILFGELTKEVLGNISHSQVMNFLLPSLAASEEINIIMEPLLLFVDRNLNTIASSIEPSSLLLSILSIVHSKRDVSTLDCFVRFSNITGRLMEKSFAPMTQATGEDLDDDEADSDDDVQMDTSLLTTNKKATVCDLCLRDLNSTVRVSWILFYVEKYISSAKMLVSFAKLFHQICVAIKYKLNECRLFFSVVLKRHLLLRPMWHVLTSLQKDKILPQGNTLQEGPPGTPLLQVLSLGYPLSSAERDALVPLLSTFSASLIAVLATLHDSELLEGQGSVNVNHIGSFPFSVEELVKMSGTLRDVCVGLVELAHPDIRMATFIDGSYKTMWAHCFKVCINVVRQIHLRDTRRIFCPEGHWLSPKVFLPLKDDNTKSFAIRPRRRYRRFEPPRWLTKDELETDGPPLSVAEQRRSTLLEELPFVFPFESRMAVFTSLVAADRSQHQSTAPYGLGPDINITVRRSHLYEDAFDKLSPTNERNLRLKMRVHLLNAVGLDEAGIDGGGIFREFLSELLKTAFDPNRGFFLLTRDNTLYPNPSSRLIADDFEKHYYFVGRMLGKALYENLLVEIPLAGFFLSKLLSGSNSVEFQHLDSLDPELCKNLLSLKNYEGDIQDLGLDFTVLNAELGQNYIDELIPNGTNIPVTNQNCIEYIYRMADYKLNKQIAKQCQAFKEGVFNVVGSRWLRLFDWRELQMMVSGASTPIDIEGLKTNTVYSGAYNENHPTIVTFWKVVSNFSESQCRQLLKFVTSCSRPPLLGFKELYPSFCIQPSGDEDRLPSASTCMNLLKLPEYKDENTLREKLLYAINSSAGFELS